MSLNNKEFFLEKINSILSKYDPIEIDFTTDHKEYMPEAKTILNNLKPEMKFEEVHNMVYKVFVQWFDEHIAGDKEQYKNIALEIYDLAHRSDIMI